MKVSCLPVSFFGDIQSGKMFILDWAKAAKEIGLDAIDLSMLLIKNHTYNYLKSLKKQLEEKEMPIVMITTYPDFSHPSRLQRQREIEYLGRDIALASELGAKYLRITAGQAHPETSVKEGIKHVVENFKRAAQIGEKFGVKLLFENHSKPSCWEYFDFSHPTDIFLEIMHGIRNVDIGLNFDTANTLVYGDDPIKVLDEVISKVITVHALDTAKKGTLDPVVLGTGIVPFSEIFKKLKEYGFDDWICIEEASNTGMGGVIKANTFVRETFKNS